jgi:cytochrome P450
VTAWEPSTRAFCRRLVTALAAHPKVEAFSEYAQKIPPRVTAEMFGFNSAQAEQFAYWIIASREIADASERADYAKRVSDLLRSTIPLRRREPGPDFISWIIAQKLDGEPVTDDLVMATASLMFSAGIRTVVSGIGIVLWHLALAAEDRRRLVKEPALIPTAIEEIMRAYSPVTMARVVSTETTIHGQLVRPGEKILLSFPAANRDPEAFAYPDQIIIDREYNQHVAFGVGIHRCAGSNLARMQLRVSLEEWLARIPDFELENPDAVTWVGGQVRGPRNLPFVLGSS